MDMRRANFPPEGKATATLHQNSFTRRTPSAHGHFRLAIALVAFFLFAASSEAETPRNLRLLIVVGESGTEAYESSFDQQVSAWKKLGKEAGVETTLIGKDDAGAGASDRDRLRSELETISAQVETQLWLILIGHGTYDGRATKFNLRGDDITPDDLKGWLNGLHQEIILIHTGSASGAFIKPLSGKNRILITATKSADEYWATRFGSRFVEALRPGSAGADQDQDSQVSLLEAWLHAAKSVSISYDEDGRIATEHSLLDDNGDGVGSRSETFTQLKPADRANESTPDGRRAHQTVLLLSPEEAKLTDQQRSQRDEIETQVEALNETRETLPPEQFYSEIERLLLQLAAIYQQTSTDPATKALPSK